MDNKQIHSGKIEVDLLAVLENMWKKKLQIVITCIIGAIAALVVTVLFVTPKYSSSVTMYANNSVGTDKNTSISSQDINASVQLVDTYAAIILSDPVLDEIKSLNNLQVSSSKLLECISVSAVNNTEVFKVTVNYTSPELAAAIANTIANVAPKKIGSIVDGCSVKVISFAKVPTGKSSPSYKICAALGAALALLVNFLIIFVNSVMDTRIKKEEDFAYWDYPMLGVIPSFSTVQKGGAYKAGPVEGGYR